jgi:hypothetical protein
MARQQPFIRFGEFREHACEVCEHRSFIRVGPDDDSQRPHYFCEDHLRAAQALREKMAEAERGEF